MSDHEFGFETRALHAGSRPEPATGARALPIYQTTNYVFEDTEAAAAYFNLQDYGNTCSRIMNPTVAAFEERAANLDQGAGAVAFASGLGPSRRHCSPCSGRRSRGVFQRTLRWQCHPVQAPAR